MAIELQSKPAVDPYGNIPMPVYVVSVMGDWNGQDKERKAVNVPGVGLTEQPAILRFFVPDQLRAIKGFLCDRNYASVLLTLGTPKETPDGERYPKALRYICAMCAGRGKLVEYPPKTHDCFEQRAVARGVKSADCICPHCPDFIGETETQVINHMQKAHAREWARHNAKMAAEVAAEVAGPTNNAELASLKQQVTNQSTQITALIQQNQQMMGMLVSNRDPREPVISDAELEAGLDELAPSTYACCGAKINSFRKHMKNCPDNGA